MKNKVASNTASAKLQAEKDAISEKGNALHLAPGTVTTLDLPGLGPVDVCGQWDSNADRKAVVILGPAKTSSFEPVAELIAAVAARGCNVIAPKLDSAGSDKTLAREVAVLLALLDWLGVAAPVIYGMDWGGIQAVKFKCTHTKRAKALVVEDRQGKVFRVRPGLNLQNPDLANPPLHP